MSLHLTPQDAAYYESLRADREKAEEAERQRAEAAAAAAAASAAAEAEAAAAAAAAADLQAQLGAKAAGLPAEPAADEAGAVNLLVRLPAGGRMSRRFRQADPLQVWWCAGGVGGGAVEREWRGRSELLPPAAAAFLRCSLRTPLPCCSPSPPLPTQAVFDFVDVQSGAEGETRPGSYHLATSYPRRVLEDGAGAQTLADVGLTARQEALFLEPK